jgi:hypothetical protein
LWRRRARVHFPILFRVNPIVSNNLSGERKCTRNFFLQYVCTLVFRLPLARMSCHLGKKRTEKTPKQRNNKMDFSDSLLFGLRERERKGMKEKIFFGQQNDYVVVVVSLSQCCFVQMGGRAEE